MNIGTQLSETCKTKTPIAISVITSNGVYVLSKELTDIESMIKNHESDFDDNHVEFAQATIWFSDDSWATLETSDDYDSTYWYHHIRPEIPQFFVNI